MQLLSLVIRVSSATLVLDECTPRWEAWLTIRKSVWFPLGFTLLYLILASTIVRWSATSNLFGTIAVIGMAFVSSLLVWVFYCLSFFLRPRQWPGILLLTGFLSPAVITVTFLLLSSFSPQSR